MPVTYERRGAAAVLTIDRPERRNAVDGRVAEELRAGYDAFVADDGARALVLTGAGGDAFCAGADLKAMVSLEPRLLDGGGPLGFTRLTSPKPALAAIEGWCVAGGLELALWCDLRIAGRGARLGCTERRFGVPLVDGGTQRLPRAIGMARALDLILSGRIVEDAEALAIGLVTELVPAGQALSRALAYAEALAAFPQPALLADRAAALAGFGRPLEEGLALEAAAGPDVFASGAAGAARFAAGEGRGGAGAGI
jgi:enoyl-CoA hydratase